jgi:hypothetical protein
MTTISKGTETLHFALSRLSLHDLVKRSYWNKRGWTYQEHVLSHNCLFITDDEVFYSCPDNLSVAPTKNWLAFTGFGDARFSNWREAYNLETRGLRTTYQSEIEWGTTWDRSADPLVGRVLDANLIYGHGDTSFVKELVSYQTVSEAEMAHFCQFAERSVEGGDLKFLQYVEFVKEYSHRRLTNSEDIVPAFAGVLAKLWSNEELGTGLDHGLPLKYLQLALLWSSTDQKRFSRRKSETSEEFQFPSWSWASWEGPVAYYPVTKANPDWTGRNRIDDYSARRYRPECERKNISNFSSTFR